MNIDDLLRFRDSLAESLNNIKLHNLDNILQKINVDLTQLKAKNQMAVNPEFVSALKEYTNISSLVAQTDSKLTESLVKINQHIAELAISRFPDTGNFQTRYIGNNQHADINDETYKVIKSRIFVNSDFRYPVLQFGCNTSSEKLTRDLVSNDPMYMCDFSADSIDYVAKQFNPEFRHKVRKYVIQDGSFSTLPQGQFGLILSWMIFNYADLSMIRAYLQKMLHLLRAGGVHIFSYNNCEFYESYKVADAGWMSYVTKTSIIELCKELGYEIVNTYDVHHGRYNYERVSWIEIKKPGDLTSLKQRQVVGTVITK